MGPQRVRSEAVVETSEREMVRRTEDGPVAERFTSLQPTYEDSVPPDAESDWNDHDGQEEDRHGS